MAKQTLNTIKNWFKTGLKPTQQQFWDTWDSFWHKDQVIPASSIENLDARFEEKADEEAFEAHLNDPNAHNIGNLSIPAGPINTLTGSGTRANLFYNTVEQVLYIYDGAAWRSATDTDLTQFYTKEEINVLLSGDSGPLEGKFIKASPSEAQKASIVLDQTSTFTIKNEIGGNSVLMHPGGGIQLASPSGNIQLQTGGGINIQSGGNGLSLNTNNIGMDNNSGRAVINPNILSLYQNSDNSFAAFSQGFISNGTITDNFYLNKSGGYFMSNGIKSEIKTNTGITADVLYTLPDSSGKLALQSYVDDLVNKKTIPIAVSGVEEYVLPWDDERKVLFGAYGDFSVWLNGSLEQVPITFTTGEDGKPNEYRFTLSGIDALILIK